MRGRNKIGMMVLVVAMVAAQVAILSSAHAVEGPGSLLIGHPGTITPRGATEAEFRIAKVCNGTPTTQGIDGWVVDLTGVPAGTVFNVSGSSAAPFTLNLMFLNSACFPSGVWYTQGTSVSKAIPLGTRWAIVTAAYGANISLTYKY